jgi:hypothetical protein
MKLGFSSFLAAALIALAVLQYASATPTNRRLFYRTYGYKTSCNTCHTNGGGSPRNPFGRDFEKAGEDAEAFKALESKDSDHDGFTNITEIKAKSNPGDPKSTPDSPGDWLKDAEREFLSERDLERIFPDADSFETRDIKLTAEQVKFVEARLGGALSDSLKTISIAFAISGKKKTGVAVAIPLAGMEESVAAVGFGLSGKVEKVRLIAVPKGSRLQAESFLSRFEGLSAASDFEGAAFGEDGETKSICEAVKQAAVIIGAIFGKKQ